MANQPGRGGAAARCATASPNAGQGSSALPGAQDTSNTNPNPGGLIHMTPKVYFTQYGVPAAPSSAPSPAPSAQLLPPQCKQTPSPEPLFPVKHS